RLRIEIAGAAMMIYLQKRVIDQNGRSPSSTENSKIRCGMTDNRSRQLNPEHDAYWQSRGYDEHPDDEDDE
ncbi:hypothetical protein, partial [Aeromonas caviae]|uniref:hypothetical protein n=1 Tax=Aeromonas caviae TaxID=648 RepID=UPI0038D038EB